MFKKEDIGSEIAENHWDGWTVGERSPHASLLRTPGSGLRAADGQAEEDRARRARNTDGRVVPAQGALPDAEGVIEQEGRFLVLILVPVRGQKRQGVSPNSAPEPSPYFLPFGIAKAHLGTGPCHEEDRKPGGSSARGSPPPPESGHARSRPKAQDTGDRNREKDPPQRRDGRSQKPEGARILRSRAQVEKHETRKPPGVGEKRYPVERRNESQR